MGATKSTVAAAVADSRDWRSAPINELIQHICETHHGYLKAELPELANLAARVAGQNGPLPSLQSVLLELKSELESHMWKEEVVLFPLILTLAAAERAGTPPPPAHCGSVNNPIRVMEMEHSGAKHALEEMRRLTCGYSAPAESPDGLKEFFAALEYFEADMHRHIRLEDDILFPRASELEASLCA